VQYDPFVRYFETVERTLLVSSDNGVPLIRDDIADSEEGVADRRQPREVNHDIAAGEEPG
jgi:hypothetical protein